MFQAFQSIVAQRNTPVRTGLPILVALGATLATLGGILFGVRELGVLALMGSGGAAVAILSIISHPLVPFALYFPCLFFSDTMLPGIPVSPNKLVGILFLVSWAVYFIRGKAISLSPLFCTILVLFSSYFAYSAITGESEERGVLHFKAVFINLSIALTLASSLRTEKAVRALAWIVTISSAMAALHGVYEAFDKAIFANFSGKWSDAVRVSGTAKNSIVFGWNMLYAFPFSFFLFTRHANKFLKWGALALGLLSLLVALLTFNRQTFVLIGIMVLCTTRLSRYPNRKRILSIVIILGGAALAALLPMVVARFLTMENIRRDASYLERRDQLIVAMEMFNERPVTGIGLGSYPAVWKNHLPKDYSTYNMQYDYKSERYPDFGYVQLLAETGLIGFTLAVILILAVIFHAYRMRRLATDTKNDFAFNLSSMLLSLGIFWLFSNAMQDTVLYVRVWLLLGLTTLITPYNLGLTEAGTQEKQLAITGGEIVS